MRIHVIQTGTVAIKQVQRQGRESGNPLVNALLDQNWTEPPANLRVCDRTFGGPDRC